jgi:hypothetical protein
MPEIIVTIREAWLIAISYILGGASLLFTAHLMRLVFGPRR